MQIYLNILSSKTHAFQLSHISFSMYKLLGLFGAAIALDIYLGNISIPYTTTAQLPPPETSSVAMAEPSPKPSSVAVSEPSPSPRSDLRDAFCMFLGMTAFASGSLSTELAHVYKTFR